jgi:hypothetical protein
MRAVNEWGWGETRKRLPPGGGFTVDCRANAIYLKELRNLPPLPPKKAKIFGHESHERKTRIKDSKIFSAMQILSVLSSCSIENTKTRSCLTMVKLDSPSQERPRMAALARVVCKRAQREPEVQRAAAHNYYKYCYVHAV